MTFITSVTSSTELMQAWRRQLGQCAHLARRHGPRPFAVVGYRVRGPVIDGCVPLRQLTLTALFDQQLETGKLATRLVGVGGTATIDGLRFGGVARSRFAKDLRLPPANGRRKARLDAADGEFFEYALALERFLERCARHPFMPRRTVPRLPVIEIGAEVGEACFIDVSTLPKRQIITLGSPERVLCGRCGTTTFDFVNTRFRVGR